jgi:hypothetical protein
LRPIRKNSNSAAKLAATFLATGVLLLTYAMLFEMQIAAFIGLGLTLWGAVFALARNGKFVESGLLDGTANSSYSTNDRIVNDLQYKGQGYYLPAYPRDVTLPDYLNNLREPVVYISENFDGMPPVEELAQGKFLSSKSHGLFIASPGAGLVAQIERQLRMDLSKVTLQELVEILPLRGKVREHGNQRKQRVFESVGHSLRKPLPQSSPTEKRQPPRVPSCKRRCHSPR